MIEVPVLVKEALREGSLLKEYNFTVYESDGETVDFVIDNDNLVSESVKFDERMCSDTNLKFGLCEGTSLEFQAFEIPNITGRRIYAVVKVQYKNEQGSLAWYSIPMGWFTVEETSRQASTGIRKISAYNKLKSEYLNESANPEIIELVSDGEDGSNEMSFYKIIEHLLNGYSIDEYKKIGAQVTGSYTYATSQIRLVTDGAALVLYTGFCNYTFSSYSADYNKYGIVEFNKNLKTIIDNAIRFYTSVNIQLADDTYATLGTVMQHPEWMIKTYNASMQIVTVPVTSLYGSVFGRGDDGTRIYDMTENYVTNDHLFKNMSIVATMIFSGDDGSVSNFTSIMNNFRQLYGWDIKTYRLEVPELAYKSITLEQAQSLPDVTLRDIQSSVYETVCQYGKLDRVTDLFSGVELNNSRLYPANTLYPSNSRYPNGTSERSNPMMYSKLWADEGNVRSFRYLIITYKGTEQDSGGNLQEVEKRLQRTVNQNGTDDYNMSDNWIFKNLVWSDSDIGDYADAMVAKMQDITWFPFEMWCAGLPYIETGDELEINRSEGAYTSYVLKRNLKGIQNLQDEMMNGNLDIF